MAKRFLSDQARADIVKSTSTTYQTPFRGALLSKDMLPKTPKEELDASQLEFPSLVGALLYACKTRPDVAFAVNDVCQYMQRWGLKHYAQALHILKYLYKIKEKTILINPTRDENLTITCYCDSNYNDKRDSGNDDKYRPQGGHLIFVNNALMAWSSKRMKGTFSPFLPQSSMEAEFYQANEASKAVMWFRGMCADLGHDQTKPTIMYEDNRACVDFVKMRNNSSRSQHIDHRLYYLRDWVKHKVVELWHVGTEYMLADMLTKAQPRALFISQANKILSTRCIPPPAAFAKCNEDWKSTLKHYDSYSSSCHDDV